jgi:hypothetical protein
MRVDILDTYMTWEQEQPRGGGGPECPGGQHWMARCAAVAAALQNAMINVRYAVCQPRPVSKVPAKHPGPHSQNATVLAAPCPPLGTLAQSLLLRQACIAPAVSLPCPDECRQLMDCPQVSNILLQL